MKHAVLIACASLAMAGSAAASDLGPYWEHPYAPEVRRLIQARPVLIVRDVPTGQPTIVRRTYRKSVVEMTEEVHRPAPSPETFFDPGY